MSVKNRTMSRDAQRTADRTAQQRTEFEAMSTDELNTRRKGLSLFIQNAPSSDAAERMYEKVGIIESILHSRLQVTGAMVDAGEVEQRERFERMMDGFEVEAETDEIEQAARDMMAEAWDADELRRQREWGQG